MTKIIDFTQNHNVDVTLSLFTKKELTDGNVHQDEYWKTFEKKSGTYCLFSNIGEKLLYVGMSKFDAGNRIFTHAFLDEKKYKKQGNEDLILILTYEDQNYMAPALEGYILNEIDTILNKNG